MISQWVLSVTNAILDKRQENTAMSYSNGALGKENTVDMSEACDEDQFLTFILSDEEFAMPIMQVKEIIEYRELTRVPMVPGFIRGAINLRGGVVPVIDMAVKFGMPSSNIGRRSCVVILEIEQGEEIVVVGALVDKVLDVSEIAEEAIEPPPTFGTGIRTDFIYGMGKRDESFVVILDVSRVFSLDEIALDKVRAVSGDEAGSEVEVRQASFNNAGNCEHG